MKINIPIILLSLVILLAQNNLFSQSDSLSQSPQVNSYYGNYNVKTKKVGKVASSLKVVQKENWVFENKANKKYKIAVFFPHMKDSYFLAVNHGIFKQAQRLGINFDLFEAGGYNNFGRQKRAFLKALKSNYDGIILASISYNKLNEDVSKAKIPIVEVINDIEAGDISAKSLVSFFDMGYKAGQYIIEQTKGQRINIAFFPGPRNSGWAGDSYYGFMQAIKESNESNISTFLPLFGDTGIATQKGLIKRAFHKYKNIDYIVGNAVAASIAPDVLKSLNKSMTKVVSTYITPDVYQLIKQSKIEAAPADMAATQGEIAVDMMVKILNGKKAGKDFAFRTGPNIPMITKTQLLNYEVLFGDKNFNAVYSNK